MIRTRTCVVAMIVVVGTVRAIHAQAPTGPLTVDQAVSEALDHNLTLLAERFNVDVAQAAVVTAGLRPNPVLTGSVMLPDQALIDEGISPHEQVLRTDYLIEGGGKRERRLDQAALAKSVATLQLQNSARALRLDVQQACTDLQLAKSNLALAQANLRAFEDVVQVNTERVRAGDLSAVELSRSRLAALEFRNEVRQQETKLQVARQRLSALLGRGAGGGTLDVVGDLRNDPAPLDLEPLRRAALESRPDLLALRAEQARSVADERLQLANRSIDYTLSGEYHRQEGAGVRGNTYGLFLSVPLPVFNRNQGEIARAQVQQQQAHTRVRALEQDIASDIAGVYAEYTAAREIVATIETQMLKPAEDVRATTEYAYRRGEATFVEFLDAVRAYNDTMQSYNEARASYARSLYTLDSLAGKVTP